LRLNAFAADYYAGGPVKILIVDDIRTNRTLGAKLLEKRGHVVKTVENGKQAIDELSKEDFDVVLMDVQMPVMDGLEATRIIRSSSSGVRRHDVPVIAVSAIGPDCGKHTCFEVGMNGYLAKPLHQNEFLETVEQYGP